MGRVNGGRTGVQAGVVTVRRMRGRTSRPQAARLRVAVEQGREHECQRNRDEQFVARCRAPSPAHMGGQAVSSSDAAEGEPLPPDGQGMRPDGPVGAGGYGNGGLQSDLQPTRRRDRRRTGVSVLTLMQGRGHRRRRGAGTISG